MMLSLVRNGLIVAPYGQPGDNRAMRWRRISRDVTEGEPILVSYGNQCVVALAFPADSYCREMTFMDARTFEILPIPLHWMPLPEAPAAQNCRGRRASISHRTA
ncbi:MAG TPA: hypothetical protein VGB79_12845 [Allosphingosinicella sp.]|jgi:hypothetical protein